MGILGSILDLLNPISGIIDSLHTSDEERLEAKAKLLAIQTGILTATIDYEREALKAQASIIVAETQSESWLTRSWRPITMLALVSLIVLNWFGVGPETLPPDLWDVIKIGLGGYIIGRSGEKIVEVMKAKDEI